MSAPGEWGVPGPGGSGPGGCLVGGGGGGAWSEGWVVSAHALRQNPPCEQTDTCKNITYDQTSLRPVNISTTPYLRRIKRSDYSTKLIGCCVIRGEIRANPGTKETSFY